MAVLDHKSLSEAARYTQGADQRRNAEAAFKRMGTEKQHALPSNLAHVSSAEVKRLK